MSPNIWIFALEPIETRYTGQWHTHIPELLTKRFGHRFNVQQIDGIQKNTVPTPGAFLNFSDTNYWKSSQLCNFLEKFNQGLVTASDHFIFTDAWNPVILQLKYMKELLGQQWVLHGHWHAGSYDKNDFLGRIIGDANWVRETERAIYHAIDHNYFATKYHYELVEMELFKANTDHWIDRQLINKKIVRSGWPMEYMKQTMAPYAKLPKRDLIVFPHRIAPEKQLEIFKDLEAELPEYEFVVCQEKQLTKHEYHTLLGQSKIVFSANLQETLGISTCAEGPLVNSIPMMPKRLSYSEIFRDYPEFLYPSSWTYNTQSYQDKKQLLTNLIKLQMENYHTFVPKIEHYVQNCYEKYFHSEKMLEIINEYI